MLTNFLYVKFLQFDKGYHNEQTNKRNKKFGELNGEKLEEGFGVGGGVGVYHLGLKNQNYQS